LEVREGIAMGERWSRHIWLLMTDQSGLTVPGKEAQLPSSGMLLFATIGWLVAALIWTYLAFRTQDEIQILYGVLVAMALILTLASFVSWRKSKKDG
jgi:hypothetical protein